jgi:hypothetical protein
MKDDSERVTDGHDATSPTSGDRRRQATAGRSECRRGEVGGGRRAGGARAHRRDEQFHENATIGSHPIFLLLPLGKVALRHEGLPHPMMQIS